MHKTAKVLMESLLADVLAFSPPGAQWQVLDVGSRWVNGSYREMVEAQGWDYSGLDITDGANVDILASSPYNYPIDDNSYDVVLSGSTMEHVQNLEAWVAELTRVLRPAGSLVILTVNEWAEHRHPVDCWRILPDGMRWLFERAYHLRDFQIGSMGRDTFGVAHKRVDWRVIEGSELLDSERHWLAEAAQNVGKQFGDTTRMAIIGVWHGASMYCLRAGCDQGLLIGIDSDMSNLWEGRELDPVYFLDADSRECHEQVDGPIHLLLIDGDHHREVIEADIQNWTPKVPVGGIVAFHDYSPTPQWVKVLPHLADVQDAVTEWLLANVGKYRSLNAEGSLAGFKRIA